MERLDRGPPCLTSLGILQLSPQSFLHPLNPSVILSILSLSLSPSPRYQALLAQVAMAPYLSSQVVYIAPTMPGTSFVAANHCSMRAPLSSPS